VLGSSGELTVVLLIFDGLVYAPNLMALPSFIYRSPINALSVMQSGLLLLLRMIHSLYRS
jgi:hypothetical protein